MAIVRRLGREYRDHHPYPENVLWLVEYSNTSLSTDLDAKQRLYAAAGIAEYWVANLRDMTLLVFRDPSADTYETEQTLDRGFIHPLAFPDLAVSVSRLL